MNQRLEKYPTLKQYPWRKYLVYITSEQEKALVKFEEFDYTEYNKEEVLSYFERDVPITNPNFCIYCALCLSNILADKYNISPLEILKDESLFHSTLLYYKPYPLFDYKPLFDSLINKPIKCTNAYINFLEYMKNLNVYDVKDILCI